MQRLSFARRSRDGGDCALGKRNFQGPIRIALTAPPAALYLMTRMDELTKLVKTHRVTTADCGSLSRLVEPDLRFFVFSAIRPPAADEVLQDILKAVATGLGKFRGPGILGLVLPHRPQQARGPLPQTGLRPL
jgi:hypothetical protein